MLDLLQSLKNMQLDSIHIVVSLIMLREFVATAWLRLRHNLHAQQMCFPANGKTDDEQEVRTMEAT